jgi:hypothetical protein
MKNKRFNRANSAPQDIILVAKPGVTTLATGALVQAGNSLAVADGQLMVLNTDPTSTGSVYQQNLLATTTVTGVKKLKVLQGTPNSSNLSEVSPFRFGHQAYLASAEIEADKVRSVTTTLPQIASYDAKYLSGFSAPFSATDYVLSIVLESHTRDIEWASTRRDNNRYSVTTPAAAVTNLTDYLLQNLAYKANLQSINYNPSGKPFVVFGIATDGTPGTVINNITASTSIPWMTVNGTTWSFKSSIPFVKTLQNAVAAGVVTGTSSIVNINSVVPGNALTVDALLIVGLDENKAVVFDDQTMNKVRVTAGVNIDSDNEVASVAAEWVGLGSTWKKLWKERHGLGIYWDTYLAHPYHGSVDTIPNYFDDERLYTSTIIEFDKHEQTSTLQTVTPHRCTILLPASITNPATTVSAAFTVATDSSALKTALNGTLGVWLGSASDNYSMIEYQGSATKAIPFQ